MIKRKTIGFHAPVSLPHDAIEYVDAIRGYGGGKHPAHEAVPGNGDGALKHVRAEAEKLVPLAARITELEAELSAAYAAYDAASVALWHEFAEARDFARMYAENHGLHDLASIADSFVYHAARPRRAVDGQSAPAPTPTK